MTVDMEIPTMPVHRRVVRLESAHQDPFGQFPTMTRFHGSKFERYRVIDLFTAIILNIGFRVCK